MLQMILLHHASFVMGGVQQKEMLHFGELLFGQEGHRAVSIHEGDCKIINTFHTQFCASTSFARLDRGSLMCHAMFALFTVIVAQRHNVGPRR